MMPSDTGLLAKDPLADITPMDHILLGSDESQWISTSYDPKVAERFATSGMNPSNTVVSVDLNKVNSYLDFSAGGTGNPAADRNAIEEREVLVERSVPASAITGSYIIHNRKRE